MNFDPLTPFPQYPMRNPYQELRATVLEVLDSTAQIAKSATATQAQLQAMRTVVQALLVTHQNPDAVLSLQMDQMDGMQTPEVLAATSELRDRLLEALNSARGRTKPPSPPAGA